MSIKHHHQEQHHQHHSATVHMTKAGEKTIDGDGVTPAVTLYLLAIERLTQEGQRALTKELAEFLGVNQSTVTEYLKRLADRGLVDYEWRAGCALTPTGEQLVCAMLRRQRLLKTFMVEQLNYQLHDVYKESLVMQHTLTDRFTDALDQFLNFPQSDPHGEVIPRQPKDATQPKQPAAPIHQLLTEMEEGTTVQVCYLPDWRSAQLQYLCQLGIVPGSNLQVLSVPPLHEPILLDVQGHTIALSHEMASVVGVKRL